LTVAQRSNAEGPGRDDSRFDARPGQGTDEVRAARTLLTEDVELNVPEEESNTGATGEEVCKDKK
jgi:hypothetical protein